MRIDNWPLDRIMRLPDWCFGRRWWVGTYTGATNGVVSRWMVEEELPDRFVLWKIMLSSNSIGMTQAMRATIRLGDHAPIVGENINLWDRLLKGISITTMVYELYYQPNSIICINGLRQLVEAGNRRMCYVVNGDQTNTYEGTIGCLISALPKEVPDWLISVPGEKRS